MHPFIHTTSPRRRRAAVAGLLLTPLSLAACGDDGGADAEYEAFCDANIAIDEATFGGDEADVEAAMTDIVAASPNDQTRDTVQSVIDAYLALEGPPDAAFEETYAELIEIVADKCGFADLSARAKDYEFVGLDEEMDAGKTLVTFENEGSEFHEMLIMRRADGDDTPISELLAMEEDEAMSHVEPMAGTFAEPGGTGWTTVDLQPGKYVAACFIPTGATEGAWAEMMAGGPEVDGPPHAMNGMTFEFEVAS